jgi:hypothetical protein
MSVINGIVDSFQITGTRVLSVVEYSTGVPVTTPTNLTFWPGYIPLVGIQATTSPTFIHHLKAFCFIPSVPLVVSQIIPKDSDLLKATGGVVASLGHNSSQIPKEFWCLAAVPYQITGFH